MVARTPVQHLPQRVNPLAPNQKNCVGFQVVTRTATFNLDMGRYLFQGFAKAFRTCFPLAAQENQCHDLKEGVTAITCLEIR